jgi:hypothetical protein
VSAARDFDFLVGSWDIRQRRLRKLLAGCDDWDEFVATARCWPLFGGAAYVDEMSVPERGFSGMSVRLFDPASGDWSIYWANSRDGLLQLPPVVGGFSGGVGRFYSEERYQGTPIKVRYTWSEITASSARWDQAFSADDGQAWETNWIMELTRRS